MELEKQSEETYTFSGKYNSYGVGISAQDLAHLATPGLLILMSLPAIESVHTCTLELRELSVPYDHVSVWVCTLQTTSKTSAHSAY